MLEAKREHRAPLFTVFRFTGSPVEVCTFVVLPDYRGAPVQLKGTSRGQYGNDMGQIITNPYYGY